MMMVVAVIVMTVARVRPILLMMSIMITINECEPWQGAEVAS
jgi:hypothetical protein